MPLETAPPVHPPFAASRLLGAAGWLVLAGLLAAVVVWWFGVFRSHTIMGDDAYIWYVFQTCPANLEVLYKPLAPAAKFRPVAAIFHYAEVRWVNMDYRTCVHINRGIQVFLGLLIFNLVRRASRSTWVALAFTLLFCISRFAYFSLIEASGVMEALGLCWFILLLTRALRYENRQRFTDALWLVLLYALLIHTHERYLVLLPFLALLIVWHGRNLVGRVLPVCLLIATAAMNFGLKSWLGLTFLMGTSSEPIHFSLSQISSFFAAGLANLAGISIGPDHLTALSFEGMSFWARFNAFVAAASFLVILIVYCVVAWPRLVREFLRLSPWLLGLAGLVGTASICIRQEMRWLYAPYVMVLLGIATAAGKIRRPALRYGLVVFCLLAVISNEYRFRQRVDHYFFAQAQRIADRVYGVTIGHHAEEMKRQPTYIVMSTPCPDLEWVMCGGFLFHYYLGPVEIHIVSSLREVPADPSTLVFSQRGFDLIETVMPNSAEAEKIARN